MRRNEPCKVNKEELSVSGIAGTIAKVEKEPIMFKE